MHGFVNIKFINTRQAIEIHAYKFWNNKFYYKLASCWLFLLIHTTMHGSINIKFINAKQATEIHAYMNGGIINSITSLHPVGYFY